jgi:hypothetical protein
MQGFVSVDPGALSVLDPGSRRRNLAILATKLAQIGGVNP